MTEFSIEIIVTIILFCLTGIGGVVAYLISDIRQDLKKIWSKMECDRNELSRLTTKIDVIETRINMCKNCQGD